MKGKFYGIGVGPGDPELVTIKAVRTLENVDIVICPEGKKGKGSFALEIVDEYIKDVELLHLTFPMIYEEDLLKKQWEENAKVIKEKIDKGLNVAFITLGDPMVYSTYMYMIPYLQKENIEIETIPGITSFCSVASKVNIPLAAGDETLGIIPLRKGCENMDEILNNYDNIVVMKPSNQSKQLADKLIEKGYEDKFIMISKVGTESQEISYDINRLRNETVPYLSTLIIKKGGLKNE